MIFESKNWPSPAKINLFLHINGRLANGYHQLQTCFQLLDYGDTLHFNINASGTIKLATTIEGVVETDNLIYKAATLLKQKSKTTLGCEISIEKVLPMGGGIGGGSSNAATTLVALNHLWQTNLSVDELADLGLKLGADVPVFVRGNSAFASGVGEQLTSINLPEKYFLVVHPNVHVSTAEVFTDPDLPRNTQEIQWDNYCFEDTQNDCQELVCQQHGDIAKTLQWLLEYAPSRMTGTGACLFAVFDNEIEARKLLQKLPLGCDGFVAKGVNRSLLFERIAEDSK
ncbi:MAG: 4-(cytidine 5'-diphospho)-2-C-methyl-D-erythritol kinase [Alteromonadaceae bacterium]|nr:4-(cytidine 5'-diphospho)-2-C-methyl-D-erythritol kinase [Alteromonadaceae bacterium]